MTVETATPMSCETFEKFTICPASFAAISKKRENAPTLRTKDSEQRACFHNITKRQSQVLTHLVCGSIAEQVGGRLCISPRTVNDHIRQLKIKFNVDSKADLIRQATIEGFTAAMLLQLIHHKTFKDASNGKF